MFFGLTNSPATFQTMMNTIFRDLIDEGSVTIYMDDIAIHMGPKEGETEEEHIARHRALVRKVLDRLKANDLHLNPDKCTFEQDHLDFLGVRVTKGAVEMDQSKLDRVKEWIPPRNVREVRKFLGFTGYYRHFIKGYSQIARPLLDLTKQAMSWQWGEHQQKAFEELRNKMVEKPVLQQPNFDKTFYLQTDTSKYGVGAVLSQEGDTPATTPRKRHPVAFYSATFTPTEQNYDAYELEFAGVLKAIEHWRAYLIWTKEPFIIEMDHKNLTHWKSPQKLTGRTARWHEKLQDYNFKIVHIQGKDNTPADALSRPGEDERTIEDKLLPLIPSEHFLNLSTLEEPPEIEHNVICHQDLYSRWCKELATTHPISRTRGLWEDDQRRLVVPLNEELKRLILHEYHKGLNAHPGRDETIRKVLN
jgi:hypothetical protein